MKPNTAKETFDYLPIALLAGVLVLSALCGCGNGVSHRGRTTEADLVNLIGSIAPWRNSGEYSQEQWRRIVDVAGIFQKTESSSVLIALDQFMKQNRTNITSDYEQESKPFLLLRVIFWLPEHAPMSERSCFKVWVDYDRASRNDDGTANLSWPLSWIGWKPTLVAPYRGSDGQPYLVAEEFKHMLARYPMRDLSKVQLN